MWNKHSPAGSAAAPASSRDHRLHSNGPTKWHSCPACFTHIPSEVDIKAASQVLSSFGDIEMMTPSLLEIASCLCRHSHNVSPFQKYPLLWKSSKKSEKETYLQISRTHLVLPAGKVQPLCLPRRGSLTQAPSCCYRRNPMNGMHLKAPCSPEITIPFHGKKSHWLVWGRSGAPENTKSIQHRLIIYNSTGFNWNYEWVRLHSNSSKFQCLHVSWVSELLL